MNLRDHPYSAPGARAAQDLLDGIDGARTVLVATIDGFSLAVAQRQPLDADRLAALISSIGALGAAASRETDIGTPRCLVVESTQGRLVVRCVKAGMHELVVGVLTDTQALLGMVWAALAQCEKALLRA
ncbi:putative regulator of Ras-like GTPase activity (Roadblock/LC7/MglB family) [Pelomonas aquatica]|uniref:Regulator of Ras-like GTPase activity (Roadblock/LC7/MglB family) n=1 Tax=Pelomonas aquatica TaxID=431058 RepID=A0ABU1ZGF6_9BURK|nr:roadblock/LC7 domain-containing protein [Pelomonas aquatica]MDR7298731.1 putative regulator of Ras-like GTPase activity (Roadblock/LC7/MglB family) [Pelomonas aquatica]